MNGQLYALPAGEVAEVIRMPALARVPQGPAALLGIANLRGSVLPVASARMLLGAPAIADVPHSAIVLDVGAPVAMAVDAVSKLEEIEAGKIETDNPDAGAETPRQTRGAFATPGTQAVARILDIRALLDAAFARRAKASPQQQARHSVIRARHLDGPAASAETLVTFEVAGQEFALPVSDVQEILPAPATVMAVAKADAAVLGITAVRERLLPLLSLRMLLGFPAPATVDERQKVVILKIGDARIGLLADRALAIVAADSDLVDAVPPVLAARTGGESQIRSVYRGEGGRRLISILSTEHLFRNEVMQRLTQAQRTAVGEPARPTPTAGEELIYLVFRLAGDEFGLAIESVVEVAPVPAQITRVPRTPKFLEGVVNLRGEVLPVVDQRRRFNMAANDAPEGRRLVVVKTARHRAGLIVDGVSGVLRTNAAEVAPPPDLTDDTARLVTGVLNHDQGRRIVLLLDPAELLTRAEQGLLDNFQAARAKANA
ncbi:MAG: chemotaxis protein CheW [Pseudomonadota bacterium]|nr:chemotaxis protein CheW [Pseudomonadota bacterium]